MEYKIRPYRPEDAEAVAVMWNESLSAWPMAFGGGTPFTAGRVRAWLEETRLIACELAVAGDGRVLGLCELVPSPKDERAAHVYLLNVHPARQGSGVGKSLLRRAVEHSVSLGFRRLDLDTWPANLKAIPLYKKCGFFWVPGTAVYMQNYLPLIMQQTPAKEFFAAHDWYRCFVRAVEATEDREEWEGRLAFHYCWREGEEILRCIIDRASGGITALETGGFTADCKIEEGEDAEGAEIRWRLVNKSPRPLSFTLTARGDEDAGSAPILRGTLDKDWEHRVKAGPGKRITIRLEMGEDRFELETAAAPEPPLALALSPDPLPAHPGREIRASLRLQNRLAAPVRGRVTFAADAEFALANPAFSFDLPPHGRGAWPIVLAPRGSGSNRLEGTVEWAAKNGKKRRFTFRLPAYCVAPGEIVTGLEADHARLETSSFLLRVEMGGGMMIFRDRRTGEVLGRQPLEALGPPFWPNEFAAAKLDLRAEPKAIHIIASSRLHPGLVMEKTISAVQDHLLSVSYRLTNRGPRPLTLRMAVMPSGLAPGRRLAIPAEEGLILEKSAPGHFPDGPGLPREPEKWRETWCSVEEGGRVFGVIWQGPMQQAALPWAEMVPLVLALPVLAPGSTTELSPLYYFVGEGDYRSVRRYWQVLTGKTNGLPEDLPPRRSLEAYFQGSVAVYGTEGSAVLRFSDLHNRPLVGKLRVYPPPGWRLTPAELALPGPEACALQATCQPDAPATGRGELRLETAESKRSWTFSCLKLGAGGEVIGKEEPNGAWRVENGRLLLRVDPSFVGACYELWAGGVNHLLAAHPSTEAGFAAARPWYGGIHPLFAEEGEDDLRPPAGASFRVEKAFRRGSHGWYWEGVRLCAMLAGSESTGLHLAVEYLTLGRSGFLLVVLALRNSSPAPLLCRAGTANYLRPGGMVPPLLLHFPEEDGGLLTRTREAGYADFATPWAMLENQENGWVCLALAPTGRFMVLDRKAFGVGLEFWDRFRLAPGEEATRFYYLVLHRAPTAYEPYLELLRWREII